GRPRTVVPQHRVLGGPGTFPAGTRRRRSVLVAGRGIREEAGAFLTYRPVREANPPHVILGELPMTWYRALADVVLTVLLAYIACVVVGVVATVAGLALRREWARNFWWRMGHLAMIGIVVAQSWAGIVCPLTRLENQLRQFGGQSAYRADFIESWL